MPDFRIEWFAWANATKATMARTLLRNPHEHDGPKLGPSRSVWVVHVGPPDTNLMDLQDHDPVSLVVAERGEGWEPNWTYWVERFSTGTPDVIVVLQEPGESVETLSQRVRARVVDLEESGRTLARAVIVGSGNPDHTALSARSLAIKAIVAPMVEQGHGTLLLDGEGADRFRMMALASTVAQMVRNTGVTVTSTERIAKVA